MLRALTHVGLAAVVVIAPALCCCNVRLLAAPFRAPAECPARPGSEPAAPACCQFVEPAGTAGCCHDEAPAKPDAPKPLKPAAPKKERCHLCFGKPDATPPRAGGSAVDAPEPAAEFVPVALLGLTALPPEHLGLLVEPSGRAGVDVRSEVLDSRHVLRC
jgi:hypothetical protein